MISQRLRGLVNLHAFVVTLIAMALFLEFAAIIPWIPWIDIVPDLNLTPYLLCVFAGMAVSTRYLSGLAPRFHRLNWVDSAQVSARQTVYVAAFLFTLMFATKDRAISRLFLGSYLCLLWTFLLFVNQGLPRFLSRILFEKRHKAPTLFIGSISQIGRLKEWLATKEVLGIQPVGFLADGHSPAESAVPFLGALVDLPRVLMQKAVAQVIVFDLPRSSGEARFIIEQCQEHGCRLLIYSNLADQLQHPLVPVVEEGHAFFSLQQEPLEDPFNRIVKRVFDIALALPVVVFVLPPLVAWVWLMQRFQAPGSVFFSQKRGGQKGNHFVLHKFRSMYDVEHDHNQQARKGDARIYPFGAFLRKSSLDEFPQFLNVLTGEMSIVGPRPHMPAHDTQFSQFYRGYRTRQFAKPGITGLAQTRGFRGEISDPSLLQQRVNNDLQYIANWSIWLDLQITVKTARQVIFPPKAAY